jgi:hypothetical protein
MMQGKFQNKQSIIVVELEASIFQDDCESPCNSIRLLKEKRSPTIWNPT